MAMKQYTPLTSLKGSDQGFTLQELLVTMVIALVVLTAIYKTFRSQQDSFMMQEQVAAAQQNLRAGMFLMESEIQMAGNNPTGKVPVVDLGFRVANSQTVRFTKDVTGGESDGVDNDGDGNAVGENPFEENFGDGDVSDPNEDIEYTLDGSGNLRRNGVTMAENIDAVNFVYLDKDSAVIPAPVASDRLADIQSVQITLVARTSGATRGYVNNTIYKNQQGTTILPAQVDKVSRRALTVTIQCRNM